MDGRGLVRGRTFVGALMTLVVLGGTHHQAWALAYTVIDLTPQGFSGASAAAIAGSQQVGSGYSAATGNNDHALLWSGTAASAVDLNPAGFTVSYAPSTDGSQQVGGGSGPATGGTNRHALLWNGTAASAVDLNPSGFDYSYAYRNSGLQQVGYGGWGPPPANNTHALLWTGTATSAVDLNPSGFIFSTAYGTNGSQQVGEGYGPATGGNDHAVMADDGTGHGTFLVASIVVDSGGADYSETPSVTLSGGTVVIDGAGFCNSLHLGSATQTTGSVTVKTGGSLTVGNGTPMNPGDGDLYVGEQGAGALATEGDPHGLLTGGSLTCYGSVYVGKSAGSTGAVNLPAGTLTIGGANPTGGDGNLCVGDGGNGTLTIQHDGAVVCSVAARIAVSSGSTGANNLSAEGKMTVGGQHDGDGSVCVGETGNGTLRVEGGATAECYGTVSAAKYPDSTGAIIVSGNGAIEYLGCALWAGAHMYLGGYAVLQQQEDGKWIWVKTAGGTGSLAISTDASGPGYVVVDDFARTNWTGTVVLCDAASSATVDEGTLEVESVDGVTGSNLYLSDPPGGGFSLIIRAGGLETDPADNAGDFAGTISDCHVDLPGSILKNDGNLQTFSGQKNYHGSTLVGGGTLRLGGPSVVQDPANFEVASGATLDLNGESIDNVPITITGEGDNLSGALINSNTDTTSSVDSLITLADSATVGGDGNIDVTGSFNVDQGYTLTKMGKGVVTLSGDSSASHYQGPTVVTNGHLQLNNQNALGNPNGEHSASVTVKATYDDDDAYVFAGTLDLNGQNVTVPLIVSGIGDDPTYDSTPGPTNNQNEFGALINSSATTPSSIGTLTVPNQRTGGARDLTVIGGPGGIDVHGAITTDANVTLNKICTGTLNIFGPQNYGAGTILRFGAGSLNSLTINFGTPDDGNGPFGRIKTSTISSVNADVSIHAAAPNSGDSALINLNATGAVQGAPFDDVHTVENLTTDLNSSGTAKIVLGAGDPFRLGAGGSVLAQVYTAGTAPDADAGSAANRSAMEAIWLQITNAFYGQGNGNGVTTTVPAVNNPDNGISLIVRRDTYGARYLAVTTGIKGDLNGDGLVNGNDVLKMMEFLDIPPGWTCPRTGITYNVYTWTEGDLNGDGIVDQADLDILSANMGKHYDPTR